MFDETTHIVTKTEGNGIALADYDRVDLSLVLAAQGATAADAVAALKPAVAAFKSLAAAFTKEDLGFGKLTEKPACTARHEYDATVNRYVENGFIATHAASFQISAVARAQEVYDRLVPLACVRQVDMAPKLEHENLVRLQTEAFKDAFVRACDRAKTELDTVFGSFEDKVGLQPVKWEPSYDDSLSAGRSPRGGVRALSATLESAGAGREEPGPVDFGKARVACRVYVSWTGCEASNSYFNTAKAT